MVSYLTGDALMEEQMITERAQELSEQEEAIAETAAAEGTLESLTQGEDLDGRDEGSKNA